MKNIFILETEKRSNVVLNPTNEALKRILKYNPSKIQIGQGVDNQFIYITNEEKPSLYAIGKDGGFNKVFKYPLNNSTNKNIVLTNDPKLIADGVQELTEEQIRQIISVPLDYVEVVREEDGKFIDSFADGSVKEGVYENYSLVFNPFSAEKEKTEIKFTKEQLINTMHKVELEDDKDYSRLFGRVLQKLNEL